MYPRRSSSPMTRYSPALPLGMPDSRGFFLGLVSGAMVMACPPRSRRLCPRSIRVCLLTCHPPCSGLSGSGHAFLDIADDRLAHRLMEKHKATLRHARRVERASIL